MSLAAAQNPINPTEALCFIYNNAKGTSGVTNLAVMRKGLGNRPDPPFRDYNYESTLPLSDPAGLDIAYYAGAPRVFGFVDYQTGDGSSKETDPPERVIYQLSPTVTPIDGLQASGSLVKGFFTGVIAAAYTQDGETAYIFALTGTSNDSPAKLVFYTLSTGDPYASEIEIKADYESQLGAVVMRDTSEPRHFFQLQDDKNVIQWGEVETKKVGTIPKSKVKISENSPIALIHDRTSDSDEELPNLFLYYVDKDSNRIYRAKYTYSSGEEDVSEDDRWETGIERYREPLRAGWRWIRPVVYEPGKATLFYYNEQNEFNPLDDDLNAGSKNPARKVPKDDA
ncbi:hypothetical protein BDV25DRAFT_160966 [Aspergillus avenaceus]|uniref:Uncharacterized protein n=1 Tax=Aspergillus avenaceus TaxID=36643 RepID=A0A5N6TLF0_ASPAV|nr:hypothetical protein BDV25DRAFT_160966 [Aspergillus avenaceus]